MAAHTTQQGQTHRTKPRGSHTEITKIVILVAFAATTDAFQSIALRSMHSQTRKSSVIVQHLDHINLRQRKSAMTFTKELRATGTLESESAYDVAQARHIEKLTCSDLYPIFV